MKDRIQKIIDNKKLNASQFADEIGVQRSRISHILSGRNKPNLEFVQKILGTYNEISRDWLLFGTGSMFETKTSGAHENPQAQTQTQTQTQKPTAHINKQQSKSMAKNDQQNQLGLSDIHQAAVSGSNSQKRVERIVLFFSDKTFSEYRVDWRRVSKPGRLLELFGFD